MADKKKIVDIHIEMTQKALCLLKIMDLKNYLVQDDPSKEIIIAVDQYKDSLNKHDEECGFEDLVSVTLELSDSKLVYKNVSNHWGARIISSFDIYEGTRSVGLVPVHGTVKWLMDNYGHLVEDR